MKRFIILFALALSCLSLHSQTLFRKLFTGIKLDNSHKIIKTFDGGFLLSGYSAPNGGSPIKTNIIKIDSLGNMQWTKEYSSIYNFLMYSVKQTLDSGFVIGGYYSGYPFISEQTYFLLKINSLGDIQWSKKYVGADKFLGYDLVITNDNGIMLLGSNQSSNFSQQQISLLKADSAGHILWAKTFYGNIASYSRHLLPTNDGGFLISGSSHCPLVTTGSGLLVKINEDGDTLWTKAFGSDSVSFFYETKQTFDDGYLIVAQPLNQTDQYTIVTKIDSSFNVIWSNRIQDASGKIRSQGIDQMVDSNYIIFGTTLINQTFNYAHIMNIDNNGTLLWSKKYLNGVISTFTSAVANSDNSFTALGKTLSTIITSTFDDLYVVKANSQGFAVCNDTNINCSVAPLAYSAFGNCPLTIVADTLIEYNISLTTNVYYSDSTICSTVGVNEMITNQDIYFIYPNPNKGSFTLSYPRLNTTMPLHIYNTMGQRIYTTTLNPNTTRCNVNVSSLNEGVYIIKAGGQVMRMVKE